MHAQTTGQRLPTPFSDITSRTSSLITVLHTPWCAVISRTNDPSTTDKNTPDPSFHTVTPSGCQVCEMHKVAVPTWSKTRRVKQVCVFQCCVEVRDGGMRVDDTDCCPLKKWHYPLWGVNIRVRVLDKVVERGSLLPKLETPIKSTISSFYEHLSLNRLHRTVMGASTLINMKKGRLTIISKSCSVQISTVTKFSRHRFVTKSAISVMDVNQTSPSLTCTSLIPLLRWRTRSSRGAGVHTPVKSSLEEEQWSTWRSLRRVNWWFEMR